MGMDLERLRRRFDKLKAPSVPAESLPNPSRGGVEG
jgi:hypothetical protein